MSDKAVYRTAPATPGLLKIVKVDTRLFYQFHSYKQTKKLKFYFFASVPCLEFDGIGPGDTWAWLIRRQSKGEVLLLHLSMMD